MQEYKLFESYTPVYYWNRDCESDFVINQGGTSSSKTVSILQNASKICIEDEKTVFTVIGQDIPNLKVGALRDFQDLIAQSPLLQASLRNPNSIIGPFRFHNGSVMEFKSYSDGQDAKSGKRHYAFFNELDGISKDIFDQIVMRTKIRVYADYNPTARFWVHHEYINRADTTLFISNFTHNPYCPEKTVKKLMYYKKMSDKLDNSYWNNKWRVYGLGLTGIVEGVIFDSVQYIDNFPSGCKRVAYGLDFGFANDPTAIGKQGLKFGEIYGQQILYETGLTANDLVKLFPTLGIRKRDLIIADSEDQKSIKIISNKGYNITGVEKGPGSVRFGLDLLRSYQINLTRNSKDWVIEQEHYKWKKHNGVYINKPVDGQDHLWDQCRYWAMMMLSSSKGRRSGRRKARRQVRTIR